MSKLSDEFLDDAYHDGAHEYGSAFNHVRGLRAVADAAVEAYASAEREGREAALPTRQDFCYCDKNVSLQMVSGGGNRHGFLGAVTLRVDGEYVEYVRKTLTAEPIRPNEEMLNQIVAAAIFDFGGWLTTRPERIICSSTDNASPMAEAIKAFCDMRGLDAATDLPIMSWQEWIDAAPAAKQEKS